MPSGSAMLLITTFVSGNDFTKSVIAWICSTEEEIFRMIAEADAENTGEISYAQFKHVISEQKKNQSASNDEDTIDAYVSMGGLPDKEGYIDADKLIKIIKEEFEMTIDIE